MKARSGYQSAHKTPADKLHEMQTGRAGAAEQDRANKKQKEKAFHERTFMERAFGIDAP